MKISLKSAIIVTTLACILTGIAVATILQQRSVTFNVNVTGVYDFNLFTDSGCTSVWTYEDFGNIQKGQYKEVTRYLKNTGTETLYLKWNTLVISNYLVEIFIDGTAWNQNTYTSALASNGILTMTVRLTVQPWATVGTNIFDTIFYGSDTNT